MVVVTAEQEAARLQQDAVGPDHVLLGLLRNQGGVACALLTEAGIGYDRARAAVVERAKPGGTPDAGPTEALAAIGIDLEQIRRSAEQSFGPGALRFPRVRFSPAAKQILQLALREALALSHFYIGTEHLLLGLLWQEDGEAGIVAALGADAGEIRSMVVHRVAPWAERLQAANDGIVRLDQALIHRRDQQQAQDILRRVRDQAGDAYREAAQRSQEAQRRLADELEQVLASASAEYQAAFGSLPATNAGSADQ
jgi:ATP-dependent Clp protease ATP-binding subunit ClpC